MVSNTFFSRDSLERNIYQISIEKEPQDKLFRTLETLEKNKIEYDSLTLVTNQIFKDKDLTVDELVELFRKPVKIYDLKWFSSRANHSAATADAYHTFVDSYLHEFNKPGKAYEVSNLVTDPRLFVFLRQQWEENRRDLKLDRLLADTLIIFSLEDTDPDNGKLKTNEEIKKAIAAHIKFDPKLLSDVIDERLVALSKGASKKVQFHKKSGAYCLPYSTRSEIQEKNLHDAALYEKFKEGVTSKLKSYLKTLNKQVKDPFQLVEETINRLFYQQGLEFADFVINGSTKKAFEKNLPDIVNQVVDESSVIKKNRNLVKSALLTTIRDTVYNGEPEEKMFLKRLANTYMMLFMLQCDPKVSTFFSSLANKLTLYVCTSIIIPALSEYHLDRYNRRHWNLLEGSRKAGVRMRVNDTIIKELVAHFRMIINKYEEEYEEKDELYLSDESYALYIDEIMIRAYFYAKRRGQVKSFRDFIDTFVNYDLFNAESNLTGWLKDEFGIEYVSDESLTLNVEKKDLDLLTAELTKQKRAQKKASNDAKVILNVFAQRLKQNEMSGDSIFGYRTWWLSKDTLTQRAVEKVFGDRYGVSCYMRPDFLYNYISLAPTKVEVDAAYNELFPSLLGVNISAHLPSELIKYIHQKVDEHSKKNPTRLKAIMRDLAERLKMDSTVQNRQYIQDFFDAELKKNPSKAV
jgi:hypothetical protein